MNKRITCSIFAALGMLVLILDSRTALSGARDGISLCVSSVVPSLFPFLVLSGFMTAGLQGANIPLLQPLAKVMGIPRGTESIFLTGILGGYPTGAQAVQTAWKNGQLEKDDANRMLSFCNNAGPAFLFGMLGPQFPKGWMPWLLWGIQIAAAVITSLLLPARTTVCSHTRSLRACSLVESLKQAVKTMGYVCGWIILFRILIAFLDRWVLWLLPESFKVMIYGILELANGCCSLLKVESIGLRLIIASAILSAGGLCVLMQTASVIEGLNIWNYIKGKALQTFLAVWLTAAAQNLLLPPQWKVPFSGAILLCIACFFVAIFVILKKIQKNSSICAGIGV